LNDIGLAEACMEQGTSYPGFDYYTGTGHFMFYGPSPTIPGYPGVNGISRKKLHNILIDAVQENGTKIYMGTTVNQLDNKADGVKVKLSNGIKATYDLVIGSDGSNSKVRQLLFGEVTQDYSGQGVWRYTLPRPKEVDKGIFYYGQKAKAGLVPMSDEEMYLLVTTHEPGNPKFPSDQLHVLLQERLNEFGGVIAEAREMIIDPSLVVYRPIFSHFVESPWYKGNVVLVGDAAHGTAPHLGQGASIAIEDVVMLADILNHDFDIQESLQIFMEKRYDRCKMIVDHSNQLVEWELLTWSGQMKDGARIGAFVNETLTKMNEPFSSEVNRPIG
jgi:2-polyprenyl-6-methoxyphenol hydroxylase-like FAD-dependent oxidoreductase